MAFAARSFIASAGPAIAVLDAPAVGRTTFPRICALERLDDLVTAEDVDPANARGLAAAGLTARQRLLRADRRRPPLRRRVRTFVARDAFPEHRRSLAETRTSAG